MHNQWSTALLITALFSVSGCTETAAPTASAIPPSGPSMPAFTPPVPIPEPGTIVEHARSLPPLQREGAAIKFPLTSDNGNSGPVWRPIHDRVTLKTAGGLHVAYERERSTAHGAALVVRPGDLVGASTLGVSLAGNYSGRITLNLKDIHGIVWSLGTVAVRSTPRSVELRFKDIEPDPHQNRGTPAHPFNPAEVYMITLVDINGFMSLSEPRVAWTVSDLVAR
jgi:hypothetical protein